MKFKKFDKFDKVIIKHTGEKGYIDAVVRDRYLVRLTDGYQWVDEWDIVQDDNGHIEKPSHKSDAVKRMLGDI